MGVLSDFALNIRNTIPRQGSVLVRRNFAHAAEITGTDVETDEVNVRSGDVGLWQYATHVLHVETDTVYEVLDAIQKNATTVSIAVDDDLTTPLSGTLIPTTFAHLGQVGGVSVDWDTVETEPDTAGRTKELALDLTVSVTLKQTSSYELESLETLTGYFLDLLITPHSLSGNLSVEEDDPAAEYTENGFYAKGVLATVSGSISFVGEDSGLTLNFPMRIPAGKAGDKPISLL